MEQTIVKPSPGRKKPPTTKEVSSDSTIVLSSNAEHINNDSIVAYGSNPVLAEANGILSIVAQIRATATHSDIHHLKESLAQKLRDYENRLRQQEVSLETIDIARYSLCCVIDEAVLNTNWGGQSAWSHDSLLSSFYSSSKGGEAFYENLKKCMDTAESNLDLLELMFVCMSLGFVGQYRLEQNGLESHRRLRKQVTSILKNFGRCNNIEWAYDPTESVTSGSQSAESAPIWVLCSVTAAILVCVFMYFNHALNAASNKTFSNLMNLVSKDQSIISTSTIINTKPIAEKISVYLSTEIEKGIVSVDSLQDRVRITIKAQDLFESGSADLVEYIDPIIFKIGQTLESVEGKIVITGHTDDKPIFTSKFPSNWHLSLARATALTDRLLDSGALKSRVIPEGVGDARPLVENDSESNRSINRRIEIDLLLTK
ncbi:type VI secretion system protein TssL, long form [Vibrio rotiferianus]|uniref:type VI secretion system protein TssL, long form n=1 Tax=Vibrio rotiferianus TaxID=190895 RepID=UPI0028943795|nr:Flagellar motor protein [Vibrio rotiferianus]CAH1559890.1 Flagellar motor protein [Vibrio rotiferianus]